MTDKEFTELRRKIYHATVELIRLQEEHEKETGKPYVISALRQENQDQDAS